MRGSYEIVLYIDEDKFYIKRWIKCFHNIRYLSIKERIKYIRSWGTPSISILFKNADLNRFSWIIRKYKFYPSYVRIYFGVTLADFITDKLFSPRTKAILFIQAPVKFASSNQDSLIKASHFFSCIMFPLFRRNWRSAKSKYPELDAIYNGGKIDNDNCFEEVGKKLGLSCCYFQSDYKKLIPKKPYCFAICRSELKNLKLNLDGTITPTKNKRVLLDNFYDVI